MIWGGAKRMGGGKRTREPALPNNSGPLQKSFWSAQSWILIQQKQSNDIRGRWKAYRPRGGGGVPKPLFGRGVIREVFLPPLFSTPPWRPRRDPDPDLPFLAFLENGKENHQKSEDFFILSRPLKFKKT